MPKEWGTCPECGIKLKMKNLEDHIEKVHPPLKAMREPASEGMKKRIIIDDADDDYAEDDAETGDDWDFDRDDEMDVMFDSANILDWLMKNGLAGYEQFKNAAKSALTPMETENGKDEYNNYRLFTLMSEMLKHLVKSKRFGPRSVELVVSMLNDADFSNHPAIDIDDVYTGFAECLEQMKAPPENADLIYRDWARRTSSPVHAYNAYGYFLTENKRYGEALREFKMALKLKKAIFTYWSMVRVLKETGNYNDAIDICRDGLGFIQGEMENGDIESMDWDYLSREYNTFLEHWIDIMDEMVERNDTHTQ